MNPDQPSSSPVGVFHVHVMKTGGTSLGRILRGALPGAGYPDPAAGDGPDVKVSVRRVRALSPEARAGIGYYTLHVPAWVAHDVAPDHLKITVLRDPVDRTESHLRHLRRSAPRPMSLTEIYDDERWHRRLADLQTRIFADTPAFHADRLAAAAAMGSSLTPAGLKQAVEVVGKTGTPDARELDDADLPRALQMLETFDVVGVTGDLAGFSRRVSNRLGLDLAIPRNVNPQRRDDAIPASLRARIVEDTQRDAELFEHACELAARDN